MSSERWTVEIGCTDRGQHKRTWMARYIWEEESGWRTFIAGSPVPKHDMHGPPETDAEPGSLISRDSVGFACSRCTRWPKIRWERWLAIMDAARSGGHPEFDVSRVD